MNFSDSSRRPVVRRALLGLAAVALALSACGSDDAVITEPAGDEANVSSEDGSASGEDVGLQALQQNGPIGVAGDRLDPYDSTVEDLVVGKAAPVISGESFDGGPITIGGPTANPTLVVFLAHWCPHCNDEIPELLALDEAGELPNGLDVIGVSTAVDATADNYPPSEWMVEKGWPWPTMADDEDLTAINAYGGTSFPFAVVLDTDGNVLARRAGQASAAETMAFLEAALGE